VTKTYLLIDLQNRHPTPEDVASWMGANGEAWIFYGEHDARAPLQTPSQGHTYGAPAVTIFWVLSIALPRRHARRSEAMATRDWLSKQVCFPQQFRS